MAAIEPIKVGVIGAGGISYTYLKNMVNNFDILDVVGCSDPQAERSKRRSELFGIRHMTNEDIFADPDIKIVVDLTFHNAHYDINKQILEAGKSFYSEKPMASSFEEAKELVNLAASKGLRIGQAPDTFMGAAWQTCRKLIDDGFIGRPVTVDTLLVRSYKAASPDPFYHYGGSWVPGNSIAYDMGGYYLHALMNLFGPVGKVSGFTDSPSRVFTHPKNAHYQEPVSVTSPSVLVSAMEFVNGTMGTLTFCSEGVGEFTRIAVYGTGGTLICPDPNCFGGDVLLYRPGEMKPYVIPHTHGYSDTDPSEPTLSGKWEPCANSWRGIGVADMAWGMRNNRPHRANGDIGLHALEIVEGIIESSKTGKAVYMTTRPDQPEMIPAGNFGSDAENCFDTK